MPDTADPPRSGKPEPRNHRYQVSFDEMETSPREDRRLAPAEQTEPMPQERPQRSSQVYRRYYRWLRLSRLALAAFAVMAVAFILWLLPWLPSGLDADDYTPELAFTIYLLAGVALTGILALGFRELARRHRESLMVWATVYDEGTGLHNRAYLYDRLSLECERARRSASVFSIIVLQIRIGGSTSGRPPMLSNAALKQLAEVIDRLSHSADLVALLSGSELAILAVGVDRESRRPLVERLRGALEAELPGLLGRPAIIDVKGGAATYGVDGNDAEALVQAARAAGLLALPHRAGAA